MGKHSKSYEDTAVSFNRHEILMKINFPATISLPNQKKLVFLASN